MQTGGCGSSHSGVFVLWLGEGIRASALPAEWIMQRLLRPVSTHKHTHSYSEGGLQGSVALLTGKKKKTFKWYFCVFRSRQSANALITACSLLHSCLCQIQMVIQILPSCACLLYLLVGCKCPVLRGTAGTLGSWLSPRPVEHRCTKAKVSAIW